MRRIETFTEVTSTARRDLRQWKGFNESAVTAEPATLGSGGSICFNLSMYVRSNLAFKLGLVAYAFAKLQGGDFSLSEGVCL